MEEPGAKRRRAWKSQHDIFLSHSGEEKAFVEQLYHDLRRVNQRPFFDQDSDCLRKAEKFAPEILEAAERCRVGVVVVSEGYLTSKWPMLELSKFVESGVPVFPLFLKLSPSELKNNEVESKWKQSWRQLVERGEVGEEVVELWSKAVKELRSSNGLEFGRFAKSEYKYRGAVVEEICKRWPPILEWSTDGIQGYERLCEVMSSMFMEKVGVKDGRVKKCLGIYGMGGLGKTTLCKSMCGYFLGEYGGRVLHLELPSVDSNDGKGGEERLARLKRVLQQLARVEKSVLDSICSEEQGWACLTDSLEIMQPMFLAIDNIGGFEASEEEAQRYLKIGLPSGSRVLVTARSREILNAILGEECCKPIPRLEWVEAATLLLSRAAPKVPSLSCLKAEEREVVEKCLSHCEFKDSGYESRQHHPLVLRALGSYFHDVCGDDVMSWGEGLESWKEMGGRGEAERVHDILGLNYGSLSDGVKLVFLDSVLCYGKYTINNWRGWWIEEKENEFKKWVSWISEVHGVSAFEAKRMVKKLQRLSMVEDSDVEVSIHDLYREFARALVEKEGSKEWQWWMSGSNDQTRLKRLVLDGGWSRIGVAPRRFLEWRSVVVLELSECNDVGPELELGSFHSLRTLDVWVCENVKRIVCSCNKDYDDGVCCYKRNPGRGCMSELQTVRLWWLDELECIPFMRHCWNLRHFYIDSWSLSDWEGDGPLDFRYLQNLESFFAIGRYKLIGGNVGAFMRSLLCALQLRNLVAFAYKCDENEVEGESGYTLDLNEVVGLLPRLSMLCLKLPWQVNEVKGLDLLLELTLLDLSNSKGLLHVPNLRCLPKLKWLCVYGCCRLDSKLNVGPRVQGICESNGYLDLVRHNDHECLKPNCYEGILCEPCERCMKQWDDECGMEDDFEDDSKDDLGGSEPKDGREVPEELNLAIW